MFASEITKFIKIYLFNRIIIQMSIGKKLIKKQYSSLIKT